MSFDDLEKNVSQLREKRGGIHGINQTHNPYIKYYIYSELYYVCICLHTSGPRGWGNGLEHTRVAEEAWSQS